jgi:hypothetical protein
MPRWIIDDHGELHAAGPRALARLIGIPANGPGDPATRSRMLEDYAIINIGIIVIEDAETLLTVRCRPAVMTERALSTLSYCLLDQAHRAVNISWHDTVWAEEYAPNAITAISFLTYALELKSRSATVSSDRIQTRPSEKAEHKWHQVRTDVSRLTSKFHSQEFYKNSFDELFNCRWTVFDYTPHNGALVILGNGTNYPVLHPLFGLNAAGRSLETLTDAQYRAWIVDSIDSVANSGRPRFDDVDAYVDWPRFGALRTRYWRMLIPLATRDGTFRVLSASGNDSGIDLRPKHIEEMSQVGGRVLLGHP